MIAVFSRRKHELVPTPGQPKSLKCLYISGARMAETKIMKKTEKRDGLMKRMIENIEFLVLRYSKTNLCF